MKNIIALALTLAALTGCSTVKGLGDDIRKGGEALSDTADKATPKAEDK